MLPANTRAFTHMGLLNGFGFECEFLRENWDYASQFGLLGPFTLSEAMNINWRLKQLDVHVKVTEYYESGEDVTEIGTHLEQSYNRDENGFFTSHIHLTPESNLTLEPYMRTWPAIRLAQESHSGLVTKFLSMTGIWIDEYACPMTDENIMVNPIFYFGYDIYASAGRVTINAKTEKFYSGEDTTSVPFFGKTLDFIHTTIWSHPYDIEISVNPQIYEDGDFV